MDIKKIINPKDILDFKNYNYVTIMSILLLLGGILFYFYWGLKYNVWYDVGIYSITSILILSGIFGALLSFQKNEKEE